MHERTACALLGGCIAGFLLVLSGEAPARAQSTEARDRDVTAAEADDPAEERVELSSVEQSIVAATREFRERKGRQPLTLSEDLTEAAEYFAGYMARTGKYGHMADDNRPSGRAVKFGYDYCIVAENIGYFRVSRELGAGRLGERLVRGWIESPRHRENLLDREVTDIGVGVARSEETGAWYAVQMFGRPQSMMTEFTVMNRSGQRVRYSVGERSFTLPPRYRQTHQRCRPTTIDFGWTKEDESLTPSPGARYIVRQEQDGGLRVTVRQAR